MYQKKKHWALLLIISLPSSHSKLICKKANQKLDALVRIMKFTSPFQRITLLNSFNKSQFLCCPLIWMFKSKWMNKNINRIHEKSLRLVLNDLQFTLDEILDTLTIHLTIHQQCIDRLLIEIYKFLNDYSSDSMNDFFHLRQNTYNLENFHAFATDVPG